MGISTPCRGGGVPAVPRRTRERLLSACRRLPLTSPHGSASPLPYVAGLEVSLRALHVQSAAARVALPCLASLLSDSTHRWSQHRISEGVFAGLRSALLEQQLDDRQRARLLSAGGQQAGAWLCVFPVSVWSTVRARHYQLALRMRLGCVIPELQALLAAARPCWCGAALDVYGFHPGLCRAGNHSV